MGLKLGSLTSKIRSFYLYLHAMRKKKVLISIAGARLVSGNLGCQALALSAMDMLEDAARECGADIQIYLPHSGLDLSLEDNVAQSFCGHDFLASRPFFTTNARYNAKLLLSCLAGRCNALKYIRRSSVVFSLCEGDSFSDIYGTERFLATNIVHIIARLLGRPLILLPQTVGPFNTPRTRKSASRTLSGCRQIMVRDSISLKLAGSLSPRVLAEMFPDLAFSLPCTPRKFDDGFVHVGLGISGLLWNGGYSGSNQFGLSTSYPDLMKEAVSMFLSIPGVKVHLIAHVFAPGSRDDDEAACRQLLSEFKSDDINFAGVFENAPEAKSYISGMDFFAGSRMHSVIAAFSSGVPCIPVSYIPKFIGMFEDSLQYHHVADLTHSSSSEVIESLRDAFVTRETLASEVRRIMNETVNPGLERLRAELIRILDGIKG